MARDQAEEFTEWAPGDAQPPRYDKAARKAERARRARLGRLPFLWGFAAQGTPQRVVANVAQMVLVAVLGLGLVRLLTGSWLAPGAGIAVLAAGFAVQSASTYVNVRAGRT